MTWLAVRAILGRIPLWVWPLLGLIVWGGAGHLEANHLRAELAAEHKQRDEAAAIAAELARQAATEAKKLKENRDAEDRRIRARLDVALLELRNRPAERLPSTATCSSNGAGATGAQLSELDASFLAGLAADADRTASALRECQGWIREVTRLQK